MVEANTVTINAVGVDILNHSNTIMALGKINQKATNDEIIESIYFKANPAIKKASTQKEPKII